MSSSTCKSVNYTETVTFQAATDPEKEHRIDLFLLNSALKHHPILDSDSAAPTDFSASFAHERAKMSTCLYLQRLGSEAAGAVEASTTRSASRQKTWTAWLRFFSVNVCKLRAQKSPSHSGRRRKKGESARGGDTRSGLTRGATEVQQSQLG